MVVLEYMKKLFGVIALLSSEEMAGLHMLGSDVGWDENTQQKKHCDQFGGHVETMVGGKITIHRRLELTQQQVHIENMLMRWYRE